MKIHPACGFTTEFGVKFIAICDLIFGLIGIFWFVYILDGYGILMKDPWMTNSVAASSATPPPALLMAIDQFLNSSSSNSSSTHIYELKTEVSHEVANNHNYSLISITTDGIQIHGKPWNIILSGIYTVVNLVAFVLLLSAAHERSILKLKIWFGIRLTIFVFKVFLYSFYLILGAPIFDHIPHIIFMGIHLYGLWLVSVFIKEIKQERRQNEENPSVTSYAKFSNTNQEKA